MRPSVGTVTATNFGLGYVEFYVENVESQANFLVNSYGFRIAAHSGLQEANYRSIAVAHGNILLVLTEGRHGAHPAREYVERHGDGVADIALVTPDVRASFAEAVGRGAFPVAEPTQLGGRTVASVRAFGDVSHTFLEQEDDTDWCPPGLTPVPGQGNWEPSLHRIDHLAVCVGSGQLDSCVHYYESVLGFRMIFEEHIVVGTQAMNSKVVQSASQEITLTIIEPDASRDAGQIDDFLSQHGGPGVQHIAFSTSNVVRSVGALRERDVEFLSTPASYYTSLPQRIQVSAYDVTELRDLSILVDADHGGQLFQIFTRSTHPRRTFFFEVIERMGALTFGSGNIKALYEAVESERLLSGDVAS